MKKLIFLAALLLLVQMGEAKTILYVTNTSTDSPCSSLQTADSLYCSRLSSLGYNIKVLNELHVKDNSTTWNEYADSSDMIFLGSNSQSMADKTKFQNAFCGNISSKNKLLFLAYVSTWNSKNISGCAFYPSINLVTANFPDNKCTTKAFKISKAGFINEGFNIDENVTIYSSAKIAKIYDLSNEGWITAECVPPNGTIDFYPILHTDEKGVFWGLDESSSFSNLTWEIFDRTILYILNDTVWSITAFTLPSIASINQDILIFANLTQTGRPGPAIVNFTVDGLSGNLMYEGFWKTTIRLSEAKQYNINLAAYSKSLRGTFTLPITVGSSVIEIISGNFKPNSNYIISAKISGAVTAFYRILHSTTYSTLLSGAMNCANNICSAFVENMPDINSLLLEITTSDGGILKTINKETFSTDKNVYKPGEVIRIDFFTTEPLTQVNLTIIRPDGVKETPSPLQMDKITTSYWNKNYTLSNSAYNGTYLLSVKTAKGEYSRPINVIAWNSFAYLNKNIFNVFEDLVLSVGTKEAYSNNLDIYVSAEIIRSDGTPIPLGNYTIKGNSIYNFSYSIPRGYPSGLSSVIIYLKDSENRSSTLHLNFSTDITLLQPSLFVTPSTISITTIQGKTLESIVAVENSALINATNIITTTSNLDMTVSGPLFLESRSRGDYKIVINTASLTEGTYTGKINFFSKVGDTEVTVSIDIIGDLYSKALERYSEVSSLENNITYLAKMWANTTDVIRLLNETKSILNQTMKEYKSGNYVIAKAKFEQASAKATELETTINNLHGKLPDYSFIVWDFALAVVIIIVIVTFIKVKGRKKKQKVVKKQIPKEEPKKEEVYFEPKGGEYRTEYY